ncbi:MAG: LysR family transcriptional regulator [Pseudomonadota bacterium]
MKLSDLKTFMDIVEAGGLTAAAHRRGVTQPALSRVLRDLETRLQAQLLKRTGRGIELTSAGEEFLTFAGETLNSFAQTQKRIADHSASPPRQLSLSVPLRVGRLLIPDLYRAFSEHLQETAVQIFEEPSDRARTMLLDGQLDAALTYRNLSAPDRDFVPIMSETLYAVGHKAALGEDPGPIGTKDLCKLPLLLPSQGQFREMIDAALRGQGHPFPVARELETAEGLLAFAAEGDGVAILPMSNVYQEVARGEVAARLISEPSITRTVGMQLNPDLPKHAAGQVLAIMRKVVRRAAQAADWERLNTYEKGGFRGRL